MCQPQRDKCQNALTLADGRNGYLLLHCKKSDCAFTDILAALELRPGVYSPPDAKVLARREAEQRDHELRRAMQATLLWKEAQPINGTTAEAYLRGRGISCSLPDTLRFHPECWHGPTAKRYPAMVALVTGGNGAAIHRTYLVPDGRGKAAVTPPKAMLGATSGGAVRLAEGPGPLVVCEGIETGLSLASGLLRKPVTVWAALSTSGLRGLGLPPQPGRLTIATDGDTAGREAGHALADRAHALGWNVSLLPAPDGRDWNDILTMKGETA